MHLSHRGTRYERHERAAHESCTRRTLLLAMQHRPQDHLSSRSGHCECDSEDSCDEAHMECCEHVATAMQRAQRQHLGTEIELLQQKVEHHPQ